ncbi:sigma-70 family RNA polymerase sigma factor [Paenibacillus soyae]|uniref:RNA polymerase sigma factor RpoD/SigA n=1 Tax=Paenibacillus soyae TaxID=2969249 RepID=A0A9X2SBZ3_9BACL|nr:RNA polymerase sigma factor RpoD/SigA [Paenibacillus soyae]MCR2807726.1 RNA polymerase sigma factor RpoD/SigA [Paenibacillus soyae]
MGKSIREVQQVFEHTFPDKQTISFAEAKTLLQTLSDEQLESDDIEMFLEIMGYQNILHSDSGQPKQVDEEPTIDDILNMEWKPVSEPKMMEGSSSQGDYSRNTFLLKEYHESRNNQEFEQLVVDNMKLVQKLASKYIRYANHQHTYDDLVSEGTIGLMDAIRKFDVNKDVQFSTYAVWWIRQRIIRAIVDTGTLIRVPVHMFELIQKIRREEQAYEVEDSIPDRQAVIAKLGITASQYERAKIVEHQVLGLTSTEQDVSEDGQDSELNQFISLETHRLLSEYSKIYFDPALLAEQHDLKKLLQDMINTHLKPREQEVIRERFGFRDHRPKTLEKVGEQFGVTRERIRQIEASALRKLASKMRKGASREDYYWPEPMGG